MFDGPNDASGFEVKGGLGSFVVESRVADEDDWTDVAVRLFLFEGRAKDAGVAVELKRSGVAGDGVPVRVDQDRGGTEFVKDLADDGFPFRGQNELNTLFEQDLNGSELCGKVLQEVTAVSDASKK